VSWKTIVLHVIVVKNNVGMIGATKFFVLATNVKRKDFHVNIVNYFVFANYVKKYQTFHQSQRSFTFSTALKRRDVLINQD
jgi:hypothetical protein